MKQILLLVVAMIAVVAAKRGDTVSRPASANAQHTRMQCNIADGEGAPTEWINLSVDCATAMKTQIRKEFNASYAYLTLGAHFSRDTINRPGFADLFFKAAKEEREHGSKLIEYLSMRGELTNEITELFSIKAIVDELNANKHIVKDGADALSKALALEIEVTKSIRGLIKTCEGGDNDYHLVDYLTGVYLEEQLHGQRELAGKLSTLGKMMKNHGALGEFLFDKNL